MADAIKDTFLAHESSKNIKKKTATDREEIIFGIALTQYSLKAGLRVLGERGENAVVKELITIHDMDTFMPVDAANITWEEPVTTAPNRGSISRRNTHPLQRLLLNQS